MEEKQNLKEPLLKDFAINSQQEPHQNNKLEEIENIKTGGDQIQESIKLSYISSVLGLIFMMIGITMLNVQNVFIKLLFQSNKNISTIEIMFTRGIFQFTANQGIMIYTKSSYRSITRHNLVRLFWRFSLGYLSWFMQYVTFQYLPLGVVQTIQNLSPFFTMLLAYFILHEALKFIEVSNMFVSFIGVLVIVYFSSENNSMHQRDGTATVTNDMFILSVVINFFAAIILSLVIVMIRQLKNLHWSILSGFQGGSATITSAIIWVIYRYYINTEHFEYNLTSSDYLNLLGVGLTATFGQIFYIKALYFDKAGRLASLTLLNIVFGYMFDILVFNYDMQIYEMLGAALIIACSVLVFAIKIHSTSQKNKKQENILDGSQLS
eukprot:403366892